jgi:hypothetical protein
METCYINNEVLAMGLQNVPSSPAKPGRASRRKGRGISTANVDQDCAESTLAIGQQKELPKGSRTLVIRARMQEELVAGAKRKNGITSDSKLLETGLTNIVTADDYAEWLFSQRGTVDPRLDLEF